MRILHCIPTMEGGGAESQLAYLAGAQVRRGHEVHVALLRRGSHFPRLVAAGVATHELGKRSQLRSAMALELVRLMQRVRPQLVQTCLPLMDVIGGAAATFQGVPWILAERSSEQAYTPGMVRCAREHLARHASAVIANSAGGHAYWAPRLAHGLTLELIPNATPLQEIDDAPPPVGVTDGNLVLFVGRLSPEKNPLMFVEAMRLLVREVPAHAIICGEGYIRAQVEDAVRRARLEHCISMTGFRSDVWSLMKVARVQVSTSTFEGRPNAVIEAMAARCPLVLSDIPAHREVADETMARFVSTGRPDELAAALAETIRGGPSVDERTRRARAAVERWSLENLAQHYDDIYRRAVARSFRSGVVGRIVRSALR